MIDVKKSVYLSPQTICLKLRCNKILNDAICRTENTKKKKNATVYNVIPDSVQLELNVINSEYALLCSLLQFFLAESFADNFKQYSYLALFTVATGFFLAF